ncbi:MAG: hypothetical protein HUN04_18550 [Desulfobacter sp.]|nr:MAG: hypothetical protein HUN04_18550 [Desulfobacter sp.]
MRIELDETTSVEVEVGAYVHDELTDTWITWDRLDPATQAHLEVLVRDIEKTTTAIRAAAVNTVATLMKPSLVS